jgi:hypothetical protein
MSKWGKRRRYVYCYDVIDLRTGMLATEAYIGKSSSRLIYRDTQHRHGKVWAAQIKGPIRTLYAGDCGRIRLWFLEVYYIKTKHPLFNVEWNRDNPHRITPWVAKALYGDPGMAYRTPR